MLQASHIPPFFVAFCVTPLASNASELVSSLYFASRKRMKNISLTFCQVRNYPVPVLNAVGWLQPKPGSAPSTVHGYSLAIISPPHHYCCGVMRGIEAHSAGHFTHVPRHAVCRCMAPRQ